MEVSFVNGTWLDKGKKTLLGGPYDSDHCVPSQDLLDLFFYNHVLESVNLQILDTHFISLSQCKYFSEYPNSSDSIVIVVIGVAV